MAPELRLGRGRLRNALAFAALIFTFGGCGSDQTEVDPAAGEDAGINAGQGNATVPEIWAEFTTSTLVPDHQMRISHPDRVEVEQIDQGVTLRYIGPGSPPASEITDGYMVTIRPVRPGELEVVAGDAIEAPVDTIDWQGSAVISWSTESELDGTAISHLGIPAGTAGSPAPLDISINISGDPEGRYHQEVDRILASLSWREAGL